MNKMVKGSVAGAAGVALLMGSFGTYALWSDTEVVDPGNVTSGELQIVSSGDASWEDVSPDTDNRVLNADERVMVPGDVFKLTQPLDVTAEGTNLKARLTVAGVGADFDFGAENPLTVSVEYGGQTVTFPGTGPYVLQWDDAGELQELSAAEQAEVTFTFPAESTSAQDFNKTVDLTDVSVTLSQYRNR